MIRKNIFNDLNEVFRDIFDAEEIVVTDTTTVHDIEGWDSLAHINLILALEQQFGIKFTISEITGMKNVGAMVDIIAKKTV